MPSIFRKQGFTFLLLVSTFGLLVFFKYYPLHETNPQDKFQWATNNMAAYIQKLKLSRSQKIEVTKFLQEVQQHQGRLKSAYKKEDYVDQSLDDRLLSAETLLRTNVPAAALLLKDVLTEQLSVEQKLQCLHNLYESYMALGPLSDGLKYAEEQYHLTMNLRSDSESQQLQFQAACDVGNTHCVLGNLEKAKIYLDEAQEIASKMADHDKITLATIYHGNWLLAKGQLKVAIDEVYTPLSNGSLSAYNRGLMLQGYGNACRSAADWGPAKDYLRESIGIAVALNDIVAVADRQGDLGTTYRSEGRIADALKYQHTHYQFAKARVCAYGDRAGLSVACFNLGFSYFSSKPAQLNSAAIYHTIQLELSHSIGLPGMKSRALNCLGKVFTSSKNYDGAVQLFNECVELHSETGNIAGLGMAFGNLGTAYRALAKYDDAIIYHEKYQDNALERDDVGGVAIMQTEIAKDYVCQQNYEMAEKSIKDALRTLEEIRSRLGAEDTSKIANQEKNQAEAFNLLQTILVQRGKTREALVWSERARARALADILRTKLVKIEQDDPMQHMSSIASMDKLLTGTEDVAKGILELATELNVTLIVYSIVNQFSGQSDISHWVYIWVVTMATGDSDKNPGVHFAKRQMTRVDHSQIRRMLDEQYVNSLCRSLGKMNMDEEATVEQDDVHVCEDDKEVEGEEVTCNTGDETRDAGHPYGQHTDLHPIRPDILSLQGLHPAADPDDLHSDDRLPTKPKPDETKPKPEEKKSLSKEEASSKEEQQRETKLKEEFRQIYDLFIAPVEEYLPESEGHDDVPRIAIIPQGFLFKLPFPAFLDRNNKHLIEKYIISFAPSIQVLQLTHHHLATLRQQNRKAPPSVLAVGNPKMPHKNPKILPPLPAANKEVQMVKAHFDQDSGEISDGRGLSMVATGRDATIGFMRQHMGNHDVLHIATHAEQGDGIAEMIQKGLESIPRKPKKSGDFSMKGFLVVLARTNNTCSGLLTAKEIKDQQLKAEVAVLSCCQTGMGKVTGDGVLGLYRSFLAAGVAGVVVTHWRIYDKATATFMAHFYQDYKVHRDSSSTFSHAEDVGR